MCDKLLKLRVKYETLLAHKQIFESIKHHHLRKFYNYMQTLWIFRLHVTITYLSSFYSIAALASGLEIEKQKSTYFSELQFKYNVYCGHILYKIWKYPLFTMLRETQHDIKYY